VLNTAFQALPALPPPVPPGLLERPLVWDLARQGLVAALVLVLALIVVRPMMRQLTTPQPAIFGGPMGLAGPNAGRASSVALPVGYNERIEAARSVANRDPRQVAQVVRSWVAEDNG